MPRAKRTHRVSRSLSTRRSDSERPTLQAICAAGGWHRRCAAALTTWGRKLLPALALHRSRVLETMHQQRIVWQVYARARLTP
eukprot:5194690-Amphidinium_carterae.1